MMGSPLTNKSHNAVTLHSSLIWTSIRNSTIMSNIEAPRFRNKMSSAVIGPNMRSFDVKMKLKLRNQTIQKIHKRRILQLFSLQTQISNFEEETF